MKNKDNLLSFVFFCLRDSGLFNHLFFSPVFNFKDSSSSFLFFCSVVDARYSEHYQLFWVYFYFLFFMFGRRYPLWWVSTSLLYKIFFFFFFFFFGWVRWSPSLREGIWHRSHFYLGKYYSTFMWKRTILLFFFFFFFSLPDNPRAKKNIFRGVPRKKGKKLIFLNFSFNFSFFFSI